MVENNEIISQNTKEELINFLENEKIILSSLQAEMSKVEVKIKLYQERLDAMEGE